MSLEKQINEVEQNIEEISKLICPKIYSDSHLASKVFEVKILYVDYFKCNTQVLIGSIKRQKEKILKKCSNRKNQTSTALFFSFFL